jgi:signal transduction histidine kinase
MVMYVQLQSGALGEAIKRFTQPAYAREAVISAVDRARQFSYRQRDIAVRFDELDPAAMISGDMGSLKHALAELLSNAMAFSRPEDEVVVTQWVADGWVWVTITDQGPGIPEHDLERVFEPYHQSERRKYEQQGIGLGLPLARGIVQMHGGSLELISAQGRGTQVVVGLPQWREQTD